MKKLNISQSCKNLIRSIYNDQPEPIELKVIGEIPKWVNGILYKNGPGRFRFNDKVYNHLFDGMACVNRFEIKNGKAFFSNKLLQTKTMKHNLETGNLYAMFGTTDLCSTIFDRFKVLFKSGEHFVYDNANVNVVPFSKNQLYALTETSMVLRLNPQTLDIINEANLSHYAKSKCTTIAHPHLDENGNGWISVGMQRSSNPTYDFMYFKQNENANNVFESFKLIARLPSSHSSAVSYFHSFGITKNYIVFLEQPLILDFKTMAWNLVVNRPVSKAFKVNKSFQTHIHLIDRNTGKILPHKYVTDPQFTFHHINAYETTDENCKNGKIVIDICSHDVNEFDFENINYDEARDEDIEEYLQKSKSYVRRIHVPLVKPESDKIYCKMENINTRMNIELPVINYAKFNAKPYKHVYGFGTKLAFDSKSPFTTVKINVDKYDDGLQAVIKSRNERILPSEPVFVENPSGTDEDDGVLLTLILGDKYDFLLILDAKTLDEVCRAELPENIKATYTFHGFFADSRNYKF